MLETKTHSRQKLNTPGYLLSGLIKCSCGSKYIGSTSKGGRNKTIRRAYLCSARKEKHTCSAKDINADYLETAVKSYFNELIHKHVSVNGIPDEVFDMEFNDVSERTSKLQSDIQSTQKLIGKLVLEKAKTTSVNVQEALDIQISKKSLYLDQLKSSLSELNSRRMDYEQAKVKAPGFDYFHNLTLSKEFMHQHIEKITADANDIHIVFKH
jgi:RNA-binding protein YlmH